MKHLSVLKGLIFIGVKCLQLSSTSSEGVGQQKAVSYTKEKKKPLIPSIKDKPVATKCICTVKSKRTMNLKLNSSNVAVTLNKMPCPKQC